MLALQQSEVGCIAHYCSGFILYPLPDMALVCQVARSVNCSSDVQYIPWCECICDLHAVIYVCGNMADDQAHQS